MISPISDIQPRYWHRLSSTTFILHIKFLAAGKWIQHIFGATMVALGAIYALRYWGFMLW